MAFCAETDVLELGEVEDALRPGEGSCRTQKPLPPQTLPKLGKPGQTAPWSVNTPLRSCQMRLQGWEQQPPALLKAPLRPGIPARRRKGRRIPGTEAVLGRKSRQPLPRGLAVLGRLLNRCGQQR